MAVLDLKLFGHLLAFHQCTACRCVSAQTYGILDTLKGYHFFRCGGLCCQHLVAALGACKQAVAPPASHHVPVGCAALVYASVFCGRALLRNMTGGTDLVNAWCAICFVWQA
jgi:hypothetical protein